jgi:hypothetical protein
LRTFKVVSTAELHRLEAVAISLGLSEAKFEHISHDVTGAARKSKTAPAEQLVEIRRQIYDVARFATPAGRESLRAPGAEEIE